MTIIVLKSSCTPHDVRAPTKKPAIHAHPIQCDISFLPNSFAYNSFIQHQQTLRPCGMDNLILIEADVISSRADAAGFDTFSMSLTNCVVIDAGSNTTYPVDVVPSTLRFALTSEGGRVKNNKNEGELLHSSPLEESVAFDFTLAYEILDRDAEKLRVDSLDDESSRIREELAQCVLGSTASSNSQEKSIMLMLDQEAQFLKIALSGLGMFGIILVSAFLWTGYKLSSHRKRRRVVRIVDPLPCEIRTRSPSREEVSLELSPLRQRSTVHETLHLVAFRDTPVVEPDASPRHWYEEFLSPRGENGRGTTAAAAGGGRGEDGAPRALFSERSVAQVANKSVHAASELNEPFVASSSSEDPLGHDVVDQVIHTHNTAVATPDDRHGSTRESSSPEPMHLEVGKAKPESNTKADTNAQSNHDESSDVKTTNQDELPVPSNLPDSQQFTSVKIQENKETLTPTRPSYSSKLGPVNILELAEHIEKSSTPFPKRSSSAVIVTPEEIKSLSEKLREPLAAPSRPSSVIVPAEDIVVDQNNASDNHTEAIIISKETSSGVAAPLQTSVAKFNSHSPKNHVEEYDETSSLVGSMSSASLLISLESNAGSHNGSLHRIPPALGPEVPKGAACSVDSVLPNDKFEPSQESHSIADSISSASLLVSVDGDTDIDSISGDEQVASLRSESKEADIPSDDKLQSEDTSEDHIKEKEISAHSMKHNVIQELKSSSRFKFKQSGANGTPSFADELAVVTGKKTVETNDFASSLAKRVAEKGQCKTPVKKPQRKVLKPVDISPPPQSTNTEVSEFLSDYW